MMFASLNEDGQGVEHQASGTLNKIFVAKLPHRWIRFGKSPHRRRSPSPEFYLHRPKKLSQKANSAALQGAQKTTCTPQYRDKTDSNEVKTSSSSCDNQSATPVTLEDVPDAPRAAPIKNDKIVKIVESLALDDDITHPGDDEEAEFDWFEEFQRCEAILDLHMFPEDDDNEERTLHHVFEEVIPTEPICPVTIPAPFGSGRKGKGKSQEEHSAKAAELGYKGSYRQYPTHANVGQANGRTNGDDPNDRDNGSGSGNQGGGRGRGRREDDREVNGEQVAMASQATPDLVHQEQPPPLRYGESRQSLGNSPMFGWACCACLQMFNGGMTDHCPGFDCEHLRCQQCPFEFYPEEPTKLKQGDTGGH